MCNIMHAGPKKHDPDNMVYTDGSYKKEAQRAGAGVYGWKDGSENYSFVCIFSFSILFLPSHHAKAAFSIVGPESKLYVQALRLVIIQLNVP